MNIATKIGLGAAAFYLFALAQGRFDSDAVPADPPVAHQIKVLSVTCAPNYGRPRAEVAVLNAGASTMEYAKVMVSFGGAMHTGFLDPRPLRPGVAASATIYADHGQSVDCSLASVVDRDGYAADLAR